MKRIFPLLMVIIFCCGCAAPHVAAPNESQSAAQPPLPSATVLAEGRCPTDTLVKPTMPAVIPGYTQLDETTGLHMTGTVQDLDLAAYRLKITGMVAHEQSLTLEELRCMPKMTVKTTLICPGNFEDVATWAGVPLIYLLDLAQIKDGAKDVLLISADGYEGYLPIAVATQDDNFLAYQWNDQPVPVLHGFPVRAVIPTMPGSKWTKWLVEIRVE